MKVDGIICVVLINNGKPTDVTINQIVELQNYLSPKIDRGVKYKFGWIDSTSQSAFMGTIGQEAGSGPSLMLINPGKRKRYYVMEGELQEDKMREVFERLASGDIRFVNFPGNTIPELA